MSSIAAAVRRSVPGGAVPSLLALLVTAAPVGAQGGDLERRLARALADVVASQALPGATAAVSIGGHVTAVAAGFADRERDRPMMPGTRMMVGSSAKPFFAFVALSLVAEGTLDLDAPIAEWLGSEPWFARLPNAPRLTMRQLLSHRGGIPNHAGDPAFALVVRSADARKRAQGFTPLEQIGIVLDRPPTFGPGEGFHYSDTGYLVAALALERAARGTYYAELRRRVLGPLRLTGTSPSDRPKLPGLAQGYVDPPTATSPAGGFSAWGLPRTIVADGRLALNPVYEWTGGGLVSTSGDLARWIELLFERDPWRAIGAAMIEGRPADAPYGLGIFVRTTPDGVLYGHPGGFPGYHTEVGYLPALGIGIAFQANRDRVDGAAALHALIAAARPASGSPQP